MNPYQFLVTPLEMGWNHMWLVVPLCAAVAVVYKTIRVERLRELPRQILGLWLYMALGLTALAGALYFLVEYVD